MPEVVVGIPDKHIGPAVGDLCDIPVCVVGILPFRGRGSVHLIGNGADVIRGVGGAVKVRIPGTQVERRAFQRDVPVPHPVKCIPDILDLQGEISASGEVDLYSGK